MYHIVNSQRCKFDRKNAQTTIILADSVDTLHRPQSQTTNLVLRIKEDIDVGILEGFVKVRRLAFGEEFPGGILRCIQIILG